VTGGLHRSQITEALSVDGRCSGGSTKRDLESRVNWRATFAVKAMAVRRASIELVRERSAIVNRWGLEFLSPVAVPVVPVAVVPIVPGPVVPVVGLAAPAAAGAPAGSTWVGLRPRARG
jgi:hypothetical protein